MAKQGHTDGTDRIAVEGVGERGNDPDYSSHDPKELW
jgi:hypothetical protein